MTIDAVKKIVVTGASGFLGGRTLKDLKKRFPNATLLGTGRRNHRQEEFRNVGCEFVSGDLTNKHFCVQLLKNVDVVIHCAALSSPWGKYETFYQSNVEATRNLLTIAQNEQAKKFIFIATPSIYFNYKERWDVKESDPLPDPIINHYASTKLEAEGMVLELNRPDFQTIALRPRAIIGAEDTVIMPRVLRAYHEGKLRVIGDGKNRVDLTAVVNVIEAINCCIDAPINAMGQSYNITNGEPIFLWEEINEMFRQLNLPPVTKKLSYGFASFVAKVSEKLAFLKGGKEPALTTYGIGILGLNFTMDITKAKKLLKFKPKSTTREAIEEFVNWYQTQANDQA